jgi:hypothetical protein
MGILPFELNFCGPIYPEIYLLAKLFENIDEAGNVIEDAQARGRFQRVVSRRVAK